MVADSPTPALPTLSPQQAALLRTFVASSGDLFAPIADGSLSLTDLLAWFNDPAVQAHIAEFQRLTAVAYEIRAAQAARAAITALEQVIATTDNPAERRRAATTILHALGRVQSPRDGHHSARSAGGSRHAAAADSSESDERAAPSPDDRPDLVADLVSQFLCEQDDPDDLHSFFDYLAPDATLAHRAAPLTLEEFRDEAPVVPLAHESPVTTRCVDAKTLEYDSAGYRIELTHEDGKVSAFSLELIRAARGRKKDCWLIETLNPEDDEPRATEAPNQAPPTPAENRRRPKPRKRGPFMPRATGPFEVTLKPQPTDSASGLGRFSLGKQFRGDLEAISRGEMLSAAGSLKGSAGYVAIERVNGTLHGKNGSFFLQHSGTMTRGCPQLTVTVVPDSATDELLGLTGSMQIEIAPGGKHSYIFEYTLP